MAQCSLRWLWRLLHRARRTSGIGAARQQALALHHYAMRSDAGARADVCAIKQDGIAADRRSTAYPDVVNLQDAIFKGVRLELAAHGCAIFKVQHIGIDDMCEAASEHDPAAYLHPHRAQIPRQQQRAFDGRKRRPRVNAPRYIKEIPTAAPA